MAATATVQLSTWQRIILVAVVLALAFGMVYYYFGVLLPIRDRVLLSLWGVRGCHSDLYPRWLGARELLTHHRNPYSDEVTREIQLGFYGRSLDPSKPTERADSEAFAYPVYVVFLLAPFLGFPFASVQITCIWLIYLCTLASIPLWIRGLGLSLPPLAFLLSAVIVMSSYATVDGAHLQQLTLVVAFLLAATFALLSRGNLVAAGVLLALATIKPHLVLLPAAFLLLWAISEWSSRKRFVVGFAGSMLLLLLASEVVLPGWIRLWRQALREYARAHNPPALGTMLGLPLSIFAFTIGIVLCGIAFWRARKEQAGSTRFSIAVVSALILTELTIPNAGGGAFYNDVLLIPVVVWLFVCGTELARKSPLGWLAWGLALVALAGQWLLASLVSFAVLVLHHTFQHEVSFFVGGPELLAFLSPFALAFFMLSIARHLYRTA
ncbi:MAG TPA: glycosyltransferase family 87 protein [Terriglobales bacterium]|nr:glycosyltransferase family 87 protein [Terriglobales bacterium]